jgi:hypothetical protein
MINKALTYQTIVVRDGELVTESHDHSSWVLVDQDCDLSQTDLADNERLLELRAVQVLGSGQHISGILGRVVRLSEGLTCFAHGARIQLSAAALTALKADRAQAAMNDRERREFKTWLGLRYDRPAVPTRFDRIPKVLLKMLKTKSFNPQRELVRDIVVYYEDAPNAGDPTMVDVWAVLRDGANPEPVLKWLTGVRGHLTDADKPPFVIRTIRARDAANTPLALIETYFALDSAKLSLSKEEDELED